MSLVMVKIRAADPSLTDVEAVRWEGCQLNLGIWPLPYNRCKQDLLADEEWIAWHREVRGRW